MGGVHPALIPAPPKELAVKFRVAMFPTAGKSLVVRVAILFWLKPTSSVISVSTVMVWFCVRLSDVVRAPGRSPGRCKRISIGIQVRKGTGAEVKVLILAKTSVNPGLAPVTRPFWSIVPTVGLSVDQAKGWTWFVISLAFGAHGPLVSGGVPNVEQAWGLNCCVSVVEVQPPGGTTVSTAMDVTLMWMVTGTGALVTPSAVAVMVAVPERGFPDESSPLQIINSVFQTPAQTDPFGETVTRALLEVP